MQVREAVIPNHTEPVKHPTQGWEKVEKGLSLMVLSFHITTCACVNAIKCALAAAFITLSMYQE